MTRTEMILILMSDERHGVREAIALTAEVSTPDELFGLISNISVRDPQSTREEIVLS